MPRLVKLKSNCKCVVPGCTDTESSRFRFPRHPAHCREWASRIGIDLKKDDAGNSPSQFRVCARHFSPTCFSSASTKKILVRGSLPTLFLPGFTDTSSIFWNSSPAASSHIDPPTICPSILNQDPLTRSGHDYFKSPEPPLLRPESVTKEKLADKTAKFPTKLPQSPLEHSKTGVSKQPEDLGPASEGPAKNDGLYELSKDECAYDGNSTEPLISESPASENDAPVDSTLNVAEVEIPSHNTLCSPYIVSEHTENISVKILLKLNLFPDKLTSDSKAYLEQNLGQFAEQIASFCWESLASYNSDSEARTIVKDILNMNVLKTKKLVRNPSAFQDLFDSVSESPVITNENDKPAQENSPFQKHKTYEKSGHKDTEQSTVLTTVPGIDLDLNTLKLPLSGTKLKEIDDEKENELPAPPIVVYQKYFDKDLFHRRVKKLKELNKQLKSKVKRFEKSIEKIKKQKLKLNNILEECKKYLKPVACEIFASQLKIGFFNTKLRGTRWSEEMKTLAYDIADESTCAFNIFSRIFYFPSKGLLKKLRAERRKAEMSVNVIADTDPPDHQYTACWTSPKPAVNEVLSELL